MSEFKTFRGIYKNAQALEDIASQTGIKSGVKEQIRFVATNLRQLADNIDPEPCDCGCGQVTGEPRLD